MKWSSVDYIQFLMISRAIQAMNVDQNEKKRPPKSSKTEMFVCGLHSISDDQPSDQSNKFQPNAKKGSLGP